MKVLCFCILLRLQRPATRKIEDLSNYFGIFKEDKGKEPESSHEICRISDGCGCEKKESPMCIKNSGLFFLRYMKAHCKNDEIYTVSMLCDSVAPGNGQDI